MMYASVRRVANGCQIRRVASVRTFANATTEETGVLSKNESVNVNESAYVLPNTEWNELIEQVKSYSNPSAGVLESLEGVSLKDLGSKRLRLSEIFDEFLGEVDERRSKLYNENILKERLEKVGLLSAVDEKNTPDLLALDRRIEAKCKALMERELDPTVLCGVLEEASQSIIKGVYSGSTGCISRMFNGHTPPIERTLLPWSPARGLLNALCTPRSELKNSSAWRACRQWNIGSRDKLFDFFPSIYDGLSQKFSDQCKIEELDVAFDFGGVEFDIIGSEIPSIEAYVASGTPWMYIFTMLSNYSVTGQLSYKKQKHLLKDGAITRRNRVPFHISGELNIGVVADHCSRDNVGALDWRIVVFEDSGLKNSLCRLHSIGYEQQVDLSYLLGSEVGAVSTYVSATLEKKKRRAM
uniref:Uncharacterized protein n=1 Tax=Mucochytrium quahogii TaxID=96639 RepID=A0A7S2RSR8_9STRA|mmetsp:Transcript_15400/g.25149  ORF Transcript_15400/g.25149 Transcript_15400/m.25149 type:complete len:412 (-) Transcript_15400:31-1266(-)